MASAEPPSQPPGDGNHGAVMVQIPVPAYAVRGSIWSPIAAIALQILVAVILALTATVPMLLINHGSEALSGPMPSVDHALYVIGITIIGTINTIFTTGQIRRLWISMRYEAMLDGKAMSDKKGNDVAPRGFAVLLGLGNISAQFRQYQMTVVLAIASLLTTSIPNFSLPWSLVDRPFQTSLYVSRNMSADQCYTQRTNMTSVSSDWFNWKTSNSALSIQGSPYSTTWPGYNGAHYSSDDALSQAIKDKCETKWVLPTIMNSDATPEGAAYALGGVAVEWSAQGTPFNALRYSFSTTFGQPRTGLTFDANDASATICLPVLASNPVVCKRWPPGSQLKYNQTVLTAITPDCNITSPQLQSNPANYPGAVVAGACTQDRQVGTATIVIGATQAYAWILAQCFTGLEWEDPTTADEEIITCSVDVRSAVQFRQVTIERLGYEFNEDRNNMVSFNIAGDKESVCVARDPDNNVIDIEAFIPDTALATAAAASWSLLAENRNIQGYLETLFESTAGRGYPLEDILGVASGVALGVYWGRSYQATDILEPIVIAGGVRSITLVRIGSGDLWALLYAIPPVLTACFILCLLWASKR
ncbi:hypothetical protein GQ53DRAFT_835162 [Thozetella sp. PMI_491]|nr:hypothetical protein GQ53DRAFT_835162 [Thozetella sp. PMI_491]